MLPSIISIVFGVLMCYCILYEPGRILFKTKNYIPVQGLVEEHKPFNSAKGTTYYAIIKYEFDGKIYDKRSSYYAGSTQLLPKIGTYIALKVNPDNPRDAVFSSLKDHWVLIFPLLLAIAFIGLGIAKLLGKC